MSPILENVSESSGISGVKTKISYEEDICEIHNGIYCGLGMEYMETLCKTSNTFTKSSKEMFWNVTREEEN